MKVQKIVFFLIEMQNFKFNGIFYIETKGFFQSKEIVNSALT